MLGGKGAIIVFRGRKREVEGYVTGFFSKKTHFCGIQNFSKSSLGYWTEMLDCRESNFEISGKPDPKI